MIVQFESFSRNVNLYGSLSALAIAGAEDLFRRQLDYGHLLLEQGAGQWRRMSAQASGVRTPEQWAQLMRDGVQGTVEAMRDCMTAASEHHGESLRVMQQNFARTQEAIAEALDGYAAGTEDPEPSGRARSRAARATMPLEKRAA